MHHTRPAVVSWQAVKSDEEKIIAWIRKHNEGEVFIHENPQEERLKNDGWERIPFTINGKQIWFKRKPVSDQKKLEECA